MTMWLKKQRGHDQHAAITTIITTSITTSSVGYHGGSGRDPSRVDKGGSARADSRRPMLDEGLCGSGRGLGRVGGGGGLYPPLTKRPMS